VVAVSYAKHVIRLSVFVFCEVTHLPSEVPPPGEPATTRPFTTTGPRRPASIRPQEENEWLGSDVDFDRGLTIENRHYYGGF
jgi:hypothetical protein